MPSENNGFFNKLSKLKGEKLRIFLNENYGYEGFLKDITMEPLGIWLEEVELIVFQGSIANPVPEISKRKDHGNTFINLESIMRFEVIEEE